MSIAAVAWLQDPELLSALEGIKKKDAELDGKIDEIGKVVGRLGVLATEMNKELKVQEMMAQDRACLSPRLRLLEPCTCTRACLAPTPCGHSHSSRHAKHEVKAQC